MTYRAFLLPLYYFLRTLLSRSLYTPFPPQVMDAVTASLATRAAAGDALRARARAKHGAVLVPRASRFLQQVHERALAQKEHGAHGLK